MNRQAQNILKRRFLGEVLIRCLQESLLTGVMVSLLLAGLVMLVVDSG